MSDWTEIRADIRKEMDELLVYVSWLEDTVYGGTFPEGVPNYLMEEKRPKWLQAELARAKTDRDIMAREVKMVQAELAHHKTLFSKALSSAERLLAERNRLWAAIEDLFEDVIRRHPEIRDQGTFSCPYFQRIAELVKYWERDGGE